MHKLSELIEENGFGRVSGSTLYRLFFHHEKHKIYKNTLDILCKFLDYEDSLDLTEQLTEQRKELHHNGVYTQYQFKKTYCLIV